MPVEVKYCDICGLPPEYCSYGPSFDKCKPWLAANFPELLENIESGKPEETKAAEVPIVEAPSKSK